MKETRVQSSAPEAEIRVAIDQALAAEGGRAHSNQAGLLVVEMGGERAPMRITAATSEGGEDTTVSIHVEPVGTGGGLLSRLLGQQRKQEQACLDAALAAVPQRTG